MSMIRRRSLPCLAAVALAVALMTACAVSIPTPTPKGGDADGALLQEAVDSPQRTAAYRARDGARHPYATLRAFGLQPEQTVIEIAPGGGWYTEILAPYLRQRGHYVAALYVEDAATPDPTEAALTKERERFDAKFAGQPQQYGHIDVGTLRAQGLVDAGAPGSADAVLTFRNIHNWIAGNHFDEALRAFYVALKPGGVLGVEEHRAAEGTPLERIISSGYVPQQYVVEHARAAGFVLLSASETNANPRDTKDHPNGVWSLPPTLRGGAVDRDRYLAIGESDRMTLTFVKPVR
jgi:predicted methyltransferase